jgi:hypothetical protein
VSPTVLRRMGVAGAVTGGLALLGVGVQGIAGMDERLKAAEAERPKLHHVGNRHDCPARERLPQSRNL